MNNENGLTIFWGFVATIFLLFLGTVLGGYVLSTLWGWFVVPTFNLPRISIATAIGISLMVGYLTNHTTEKKKEKNDTSYLKLIVSSGLKIICRPLVALVFGWIIKSFL